MNLRKLNAISLSSSMILSAAIVFLYATAMTFKGSIGNLLETPFLIVSFSAITSFCIFLIGAVIELIILPEFKNKN
jgi:hypothetical protein